MIAERTNSQLNNVNPNFQNTTQFLIERGVPIPECKRGRGPQRVYPYHLMQIGDSFFVPNKKTIGVSIPGKKFTSRAVDGGVRVWRIA